MYNIYIYTGSKIIKPMNILHEIQKNHQKLHETPWNSITIMRIMSESQKRLPHLPSFQQQNSRCLAELEEELPEILFRCAEHVSHWISHKSRWDLGRGTRPIPWESDQNPMMKCHHELDGISWDIVTDMTLWWNLDMSDEILDIIQHNHGYQHKLYISTKFNNFQHKLYQKISQTMRYPWDPSFPARPAQSTDGSAQQSGRVRFGSDGATGARSAVLPCWYPADIWWTILNHAGANFQRHTDKSNIDIMIFNHHKHYIYILYHYEPLIVDQLLTPRTNHDPPRLSPILKHYNCNNHHKIIKSFEHDESS